MLPLLRVTTVVVLPVVVAGRDRPRLSTPVARVVLRCGQTLRSMSLMLVTMYAILDGIVDHATGGSEFYCGVILPVTLPVPCYVLIAKHVALSLML